MKAVSTDIKKLVRPNILSLKPYSSARDEYQDAYSDMVFLDANENPFENGVNRYPDPQQKALKTALSETKNVSPSQLLLGNGSDEVLDLIFRAFCEPGIDNIITLPPTYGMYSVLAGINNIENRTVPLKSNFEPDVAKIITESDQHTKLIFLCSPNNPTANSFSAETIENLLLKFKGIVVIDEAYIDFSPYESWVSRLDSYPNLIVTQTLSKAFGIAGVRLGICYASEEIIEILNKIKPPYNVNELTQQKALARVSDMSTIKDEVSRILNEKKILSKALPEISFIDHVYPSDTNFLLVKVDDAYLRYKQLIEQGVVVRNRSNQLHCENTLRFTVGTPKENKKLLRALEKIQ